MGRSEEDMKDAIPKHVKCIVCGLEQNAHWEASPKPGVWVTGLKCTTCGRLNVYFAGNELELSKIRKLIDSQE
jgi:hypothetical protein